MTSYLLQEESPVSGLSSGIISFWVKCDAGGAGESIDSNWMPVDITKQLGSNQVSFPGASYYRQAPSQFTVPHIWCYPFPGPDGDPTSFKDGLVPFLTFGDPNLPFERIEWKLKKLNTIWVFGKGGVPQELMSQYPEKVGEPVKGLVPPSCVGAFNDMLRVILQTSSRGQYKGCAWAQASSQETHMMTPISCQDLLHNTHPCSEPEAWVDMSAKIPTKPNQATGFNFKYQDVSMLECAQHPEAFIMDVPVSVGDGGWHHVLISFDLSGKAAAGGQDGYIEYDTVITGVNAETGEPITKEVPRPREEESDAVQNAKCEIKAEATGPDGDPPLPGPWGQYSGANGEYALAPFGYIINDPGYPFNVSYASKAAYGRPFEEVGKYGPASGGKITSTCRGWVAVDDETYDKGALNHRDAYNQCKSLSGFDSHAMAPPNAFLIPGAEIRGDMTTNMTLWERDYRTMLGAFNGPAVKMPDTDEMRRLDYVRPSYTFSSGSIAGSGPFAIPGGPQRLWGRHDRNYNVIMAELQIWSGKHIDLEDETRRRLFITDSGNPAPISRADKHLGQPNVRLHWSTHWIHGINTGSSGDRKTGAGAGTDPKKVEEKDPRKKLVPSGDIERYTPDPP